MSIARGLMSLATRRNSKNRSSVRCLPALYFLTVPHSLCPCVAARENEAHGGEPSKRSSSPRFTPAILSSSSPVISRMSFSTTITPGAFARYVSAALGMNSQATRTSNPARVSPSEDPPHPLNVEMTTGLLILEFERALGARMLGVRSLQRQVARHPLLLVVFGVGLSVVLVIAHGLGERLHL